MRISLAQINTTVADFAGNRARIESAYRQAAAGGAELVLFPELAVCGYPPLDLLHRPEFWRSCEDALARLAERLDGPPAIVGTLRTNPLAHGLPIHNSAAVIHGRRVIGWHDKVLLPTYDVFDEARYFQPGGEVRTFEHGGVRFGVAICEDLWTAPELPPGPRYARNPALELRKAGAQILLVPSSSPFHVSKPRLREAIFQAAAANAGVPVLVCNQVGGNTELIFDGGSIAVLPDGIAARAPNFAECVFSVDSERLRHVEVRADQATSATELATGPDLEEMAEALVLGIRDYFRKCGFQRACVGLSGGIDSALTAALACAALGREAVRGLAMPSRYSSRGSVEDAMELARRLGIECRKVSIEPVFKAYLSSLAELFGEPVVGVTAENLQARTRGALLMALSNRDGDLVLSTGNKSELAVGYCTLYGDMCGGLSPLGDLYKTVVYRMARLPRFRDLIPESTMTKPPSAELRENQTDQDTLPPYEVLDAVLEAHLEREASEEEIVADGHPLELVRAIVRLVEQNEYKRRQGAPVLRVTPKAFGIGRRYPIARSLRATDD